MKQQHMRTAMLIGEEAVEKLKCKRVAVFGLGGVGGYVVEALARCGVGTIDLFDGDVVTMSNINRQILATADAVGESKAAAAKRRVNAIDPDICANEHAFFFNKDTCGEVDFSVFDYVVDAIDSVPDKVLIIECCKRAQTPVISCMGTGNKLNPMGFKVADIEKTSVCPLARVMRRELKSKNISGVKVVYSEEQPVAVAQSMHSSGHIPASIAFVPPAAGLLLASEAVKYLIS